jgi:hypothetical protein
LEAGSYIEAPRKRKIDTSSREARLAVADTVQRFGPWREKLAGIAARAERQLSETDRAHLVTECLEIEAALREARTEIILQLAEAPRKVTSNSRVVDIERAFDNIEATLGAIRDRLTYLRGTGRAAI